MKTFFNALFALMFAFTSKGWAQGTFNVDHGELTLISDEGMWRRFATDYPIAGGWMSSGTPVNAGNGPNGAIWVHRYHDVQTSESWGVHQTPITMEQYNDPSTIEHTWSWGIYWVNGENKVLEYGAFDQPYPEGFWDYSISYSAAIVPEPFPGWLIMLGFLTDWILRRRTRGLERA